MLTKINRRELCYLRDSRKSSLSHKYLSGAKMTIIFVAHFNINDVDLNNPVGEFVKSSYISEFVSENFIQCPQENFQSFHSTSSHCLFCLTRCNQNSRYLILA